MPSDEAQPIKIAILAMGGEGGGVLADWIVALGESEGYLAQSTSVPGVAQRTGATLYYVELFPRALAEARGAVPVLALMPLPGDVDIVLASELMEAGRALQRGLVTPERTTLVASTHRVYAIAEKLALGDGRVDAANLLAHAQAAAQRFVGFDMAAMAEAQGCALSAVLLGALAGSAALPFARAGYEAAIRRSGVGVASSLKGFEAAWRRAGAAQDEAVEAAPAEADAPMQAEAEAADPQVRALLERARQELPWAAQGMAREGLRRLLDYQDVAYAAQYLDRLARLAAAAPGDAALLVEAARHLALWMAYEDPIRVADLKTRAARFERVRGEQRLEQGQLLQIAEFMHPRLQEVCDTLPAGLGRWLAASGWPRRCVEALMRRGRVVRTSTLGGFLLLYLLAGLRRWRRGTLRHQREQEHIEHWLRHVASAWPLGPEVALELVRCQQLVKGYGQTQERGWAQFRSLMDLLDRPGRLSAATLRDLRVAALADEEGKTLREALARMGLATVQAAAS